MKDSEEQKTVRQYLLGEIGGPERESFEERVLLDPEYKERVSLVEDELIEDFVANELSGSERERFVKHFLSTPQQVQRLELAKALHSYFYERSPILPLPANRKPSLWRSPAADPRRGKRNPFSARVTMAALIVVMVGVASILAWLYWQGRPADKQVALRQELARLNDPQHSDDELSKKSTTFRVNLTVDFVRSAEGMPKVPVPAEAQVVQLEFPPAQYQSYRATLRMIEGAEIFTLPSLAAGVVDGNKRLRINIPAELLPRGDYELSLTGVRENGQPSDAVTYYFRIVR